MAPPFYDPDKPIAGNTAVTAFDKAQILALFDGDTEFLSRIIEIFLEDCPKRMQDLRDSVLNEQADHIQKAAHAIKGAVAQFGAQSASELAQCLENHGRQCEMPEAREALGRLELQMACLVQDLEKFVIHRNSDREN